VINIKDNSLLKATASIQGKNYSLIKNKAGLWNLNYKTTAKTKSLSIKLFFKNKSGKVEQKTVTAGF